MRKTANDGAAIVFDGAGRYVSPLVEIGWVFHNLSGAIHVPLGTYVPVIVLQQDLGGHLGHEILAIDTGTPAWSSGAQP